MGDSGWISIVNFFEDIPQLSIEKDVGQYSEKIRRHLTCKNYGFECSFRTNEYEIEKIVEEFREHAMQEHNMDYPAGILKKSLMWKKLIDSEFLSQKIISKSISPHH